MKKAFSILLLAGLLVQSLHYPLLRLKLEMEREHIAATLCANRLAAPVMCHGQCAIDDIIIAHTVERESDSATVSDVEFRTFLLQCPPEAPSLALVLADYDGHSAPSYTDAAYHLLLPYDLFSPPKA